MADATITVRDVHLDIPIYSPGHDRLIRLSRPASVGGNIERDRGKMVVHALRGISLELKRGDSLALMGPNGAGKSTLLRAIAGILPIQRGEITVQGSVGCLFEMGAGLSYDFTGNECIKHQCLINRLPHEQWPEIIRDVTDFTDLGAYLDLPVRTYSDGMRARLFAAIATAWKHDILLVDEGIGAGDRAFQEKFSRRVQEFMTNASLLVIASHNLDLLRQYCTKGAVIQQGQLQALGNVEETLKVYLEAV